MDGPPPLEDCTDILKQRKASLPSRPTSSDAPKTSSFVLPKTNSSTPADSSLLSLERRPAKKKVAAKKPFSGLKAGFLNDSSPVQTLKPTSSPLVLDPVQQAMASSPNFSSPEFLAKVDANPRLAKAFQDEAFAQAAIDMAQDPQTAMKKYSETRPDLVQALKEFAGLMGKEMESVQQDSTIKPALDASEQALVDRVLTDDRILEVMKDPGVQHILSLAKSGRHAQLFGLLSRDAGLRSKIDLLRETGLIRFEN